jgi:diacylglycerol kinase (ATP)
VTSPAPAPRVAILNPISPGARRRPRIAELLQRVAGAEVRVTSGPGEASRLAREAAGEGVGTLIVAGGDGTIHEVANGLAGSAPVPRLALVPLGTGNDLAGALGIPFEPQEALALLERGASRPLDLVAVTGLRSRRVANFAMGGFAGQIADRVTPRRRRLWGRHVYLRAALDEIAARRARRMSVRADDRELPVREALAVLVANGPRFGGGIPMAPAARLDDGALDLLVLRAVPLPALLRVIARALRGRHLEDPAVISLRARRVEVRTEPDLPWNGDGEGLGTGSATFEALPAAVSVQVPPLATREGVPAPARAPAAGGAS